MPLAVRPSRRALSPLTCTIGCTPLSCGSGSTSVSTLAGFSCSASVLTDVDTDQQDNGVQTMVQVNGDSARRLGLTANGIDAALYDAFGQRQVATIYTELNQYHVVMEWAPDYTRGPNALSDVYAAATRTVESGGQAVSVESP